MVRVKPFKGIRPQAELAEKVSALPYDVMNRSEAKEMAQDNEYSFLHISRAEIDFPEEVGDYEECVYQKARKNLLDFVEKGILFMEDKPVYYIYREIMGETVQTGIVAAVAVADYENGSVMKHELTRKEKEQDRIHHFDVCNCHTEPVFLTYRPVSYTHLDVYKRQGCENIVLLNIATAPQYVKNVNNFLIENNGAGIISYGSIHPQYTDYKDEIQRLWENGIKGVKFHPEYQEFALDDKKVYPIYEELANRDMVIPVSYTHLDVYKRQM